MNLPSDISLTVALSNPAVDRRAERQIRQLQAVLDARLFKVSWELCLVTPLDVNLRGATTELFSHSMDTYARTWSEKLTAIRGKVMLNRYFSSDCEFAFYLVHVQCFTVRQRSKKLAISTRL